MQLEDGVRRLAERKEHRYSDPTELLKIEVDDVE